MGVRFCATVQSYGKILMMIERSDGSRGAPTAAGGDGYADGRGEQAKWLRKAKRSLRRRTFLPTCASCSSHFRLRIGLGDADLAIQSASAHSLTSSIMARVYVGNLDPGTEKEALKDAFEKHGRLADVWIARNPPGFAFIVRR